jgi:hypothetical protein
VAAALGFVIDLAVADLAAEFDADDEANEC